MIVLWNGLFFVIIFTGIHRTMKAAGYKRNTEARKFNWYAISLIVIVIVQAIAEVLTLYGTLAHIMVIH